MTKYTVASIKSIRADQLTFTQLRVVCVKLSVQGYKSNKKSELLDLIAAKMVNEDVYEGLSTSGQRNGTKKLVQCPFRLLIVLFSDQFTDRSSPLGDAAQRSELDADRGGSSEDFWRGIGGAFINGLTGNSEVNELQFEYPVLTIAHIDMSGVVKHEGTSPYPPSRYKIPYKLYMWT